MLKVLLRREKSFSYIKAGGGFEPSPSRLQGGYSSAELHRHKFIHNIQTQNQL